MTTKMPALFIGHGSPMNAIETNDFTRSLNALGKTLPVPKAILVVSAHWVTRGTFAASTATPETIYDFSGFPDALYKVVYPASGSPTFARNVQEIDRNVTLDPTMGLDHGAWSVLMHLYPKADVPVFQVSLNAAWTFREHYEFAQKLARLRNEGVLILSSGNIVHNLRRGIWHDVAATPYPWASTFDEQVKAALLSHDHETLINAPSLAGEAFVLSHPSVEHYLPLLYTIGVQAADENVTFVSDEFQYASFSMRSFQIN
jgi:4,5-DOPA dioxygenase extradiol